jgi:hypothetical protein
LNLDPSTFGSFAEIGAGQEVARWFLLVGRGLRYRGQTISAYDKEVSDDLYGSDRYVSKQRLEAMLTTNDPTSHAIKQNPRQQTRFFCFADTVSACNFAGPTTRMAGSAWFQLQPGGPPSDLPLHVNCAILPTFYNSKSSILGVNSSTPRSMKRKPVNHF